jgi:hypothetical protein
MLWQRRCGKIKKEKERVINAAGKVLMSNNYIATALTCKVAAALHAGG